MNLAGDVARGKKLFEENCATCHMPRRQGGRVGPDLSGINNKTKEELITSILNPSYAIEPRFVNYVVTTSDGRMYDGMIANETPGRSRCEADPKKTKPSEEEYRRIRAPRYR